MPELPEVETIRRVLEPQIRGLEIMNITVEKPEVISHPAAGEFCRLLTGQVIASMSRRGKYLRIHMNSGDNVTLHLRMTGCLLVTPPDYPVEKHTHIAIRLSNCNELRFLDTRRFGRFWLIQDGEADTYSGIDKLGIEPFDTELNAEYLKAHFGKCKKAVKTCLLEQSVIAGIGNIYSDGGNTAICLFCRYMVMLTNLAQAAVKPLLVSLSEAGVVYIAQFVKENSCVRRKRTLSSLIRCLWNAALVV